MSTREQIDADFKEAMKARDTARLETIKMMRAAVKNKEIEKMETLSEDEVVAVLGSEVKKLNDSLEQFRSGNRDDLVAKTEAELAVVKSYLPEPLSEEEVKKIIEDKVAEAGEVTQKDFGRIMKSVMAEAKGRTDGSVVSRLVKEVLQG